MQLKTGHLIWECKRGPHFGLLFVAEHLLPDIRALIYVFMCVCVTTYAPT